MTQIACLLMNVIASVNQTLISACTLSSTGMRLYWKSFSKWLGHVELAFRMAVIPRFWSCPFCEAWNPEPKYKWGRISTAVPCKNNFLSEKEHYKLRCVLYL